MSSFHSVFRACYFYHLIKLVIAYFIVNIVLIFTSGYSYAQAMPSDVTSITNNTNNPVIIRSSTAPTASKIEETGLKTVTHSLDIETEFQRFIKRTSGHTLFAFGSQLFSTPQVEAGLLTTQDVTPVSPDYTLGVGDEVMIKAWGAIDVDYRSSIDRNGQIAIPKIGSLRLAGLKVHQLEPMIQQSFSRLYKNFTVSATLGKLRPIHLYVVGRAVQPKVYTLPAMSTLLSAVFASGGPAHNGSMRQITLQRLGKTIATLDIYDFLLKGDRKHDVDLRDGDTLIFNPVGTRIAVIGAVDKPYIYELKPNETRLNQLLNYIGGLNVTTSLFNASIERLNPTNQVARTLIQVKLDTSTQSETPLQDGDVLTLQTVREEFKNVVTLRGNVALPLRYPYTGKMRITDLIPDRQALITPDYFARKNILVQPVDATIKGSNGVDDSTLISDKFNMADNINWDYAVIERLTPDLTVELIPFNLGEAVLKHNQAHNLNLEPGDVITVFSTRQVRVSQTKQTRMIKLEGEFNVAGVYQVNPNETLRQLVQRVGGLTHNAYLYGAVLTRNSVRSNQQQAMNKAIETLEYDLNIQSLTRASGTEIGQTQIANQFVSKIKTLKPTGRLVMDIPVAGGLANIPDIDIEDGDSLYVPPLQSTVSVLGAVHNQHTVVFTPHKTLSHYIEEAGGITPSADSDNIYVLRANGSITRKTNRWLGWLNSNVDLKPGDSIIVSEDIKRFDTMNNYKGWASIFSQFSLGVASLKVLGLY